MEAAALGALLAAYAAWAAPSLRAPPHGWHAWREADTLIVGRNFCREGVPLWEPHVDARGDTPGVTGMEFPLLTYLHGLVLCRGGDQVLVARLTTLLATLLAAVATWGLARRTFGVGAAVLAAALVLSAPIVVYYGRSVLPDMPAVALATAGLWAFRSGLSAPRPRLVALTSTGLALLTLGSLVKLPVLPMALAFGASVIELRRPRRPPEVLAWAAGFAAAVAIVAAWYVHARELQTRHHLYTFMVVRGPAEIVSDLGRSDFWRLVFVQHPFDAWIFPPATVFALIAFTRRRLEMPGWICALSAGVLAYLFGAGYSAGHHVYYGLPVVPLLALVAGGEIAHWIAKLPRARSMAGVAVVVVASAYGAWRSAHWFPPPQPAAEADLRAGKAALDAVAGPAEKVTLFSEGSPLLLWGLDRRGWIGSAQGSVESVDRGEVSTRIAVVVRDALDGPPARELEAALRRRGFALVYEASGYSIWDRGRAGK